MITIEQYFNNRVATDHQLLDAEYLLRRVNSLLEEYYTSTGNRVIKNPNTKTMIAGVTEGGFRLPNCEQGAPKSSHKEAKGIDIYDPFGQIDQWITRNILLKYELYREHPDHTNGWVHLTTRPPKSGTRTFMP